MDLKLISSSKCFEGEQRVYSHFSKKLGCEMQFGIYMPPAAVSYDCECPVLYMLSGLGSTYKELMQRSGMQKYAAYHNLIVVNPDTSPRYIDFPGQNDIEHVGPGASFYIDATQEPWCKNYRMFSYVTKELIMLIKTNFHVQCKQGIMGYSMGGHGALICALKNPGLYYSVSAFAPVGNLAKTPLGERILGNYLGCNKDEWRNWDATCLAECYSDIPIELFIDQGSIDVYLLEKHLLPENLLEAASKNCKIRTIYKLRDGYGHEYEYILTFISEHIDYHANLLKS